MAYDVIVVGCGGMGSATLYELARRGLRVLGLEQFTPVHDQGSSHGQTRVTRKAYYEHPDYVPLVRRAYERWYDLEQLAGRRLLVETGCLSIGRPDSKLITGILRSASEHRLPVEPLGPDDIRRRYPQFRFEPEYVGVLESEAGFLYVEECVRAHLEAARACGAELRAEEAVREWNATADGVTVRTDRGTYEAAKLVLTAGPWAGQLLAARGVPLTVMRQVLCWFGTADDRLYRRDVFPIYITEMPEGHFYGFPVIDGGGHKVARHYGAPELPGPEAIDRTATAADGAMVRDLFLARRLPGVDGPLRRAAVCTYTLTPDRHFILDLHPDHANVAVAAGFSGHGFKFASVVGEVMADLAERGRSELPIGMFTFRRFEAK